MTAFALFSTWTAIKGAVIALSGLVLVWLKWKTKRDAEKPTRTADQALQDSASGDDAALNADLDAAERRLRDKGR